MQIQKTLPKNDGFFAYYAGLIPALHKVGILSQLFGAAIEFYILTAILRPKFEAAGIGHVDAYTTAAALLLIALLEIGLRAAAAYSVRAVLHRKFAGLDLVMTVFIFVLTAALAVCSIGLHVGGSKEAVEANTAGPELESTAAADNTLTVERAAALRNYASDSAAVIGRYAAEIGAAKTAAKAEARAALLRPGATAADVEAVRATGAAKVADLESRRGAELAGLLKTKNDQLDAARARRDQAAAEIGGRNNQAREKTDGRAAKYAGWLSTFSVLTVVFVLLSIGLNEVYHRGAGIERAAIPHQYWFEPGLWAKFSTAVSNKFQYHARALVERIERATPAPAEPLRPHPLFDYDGLTPERRRLALAERLNTPSARNLTTAETVTASVPAERDTPTRARNNGPVNGGLGSAICARPGCGLAFDRRALNQKYCSEKCKLDDHATRHGGRAFEPGKLKYKREGA